MSHHQNAGQGLNVMIADKSLKNVAELKYSGTTIICQRCIHKEINNRLNLVNACCHSVPHLLTSHISNNLKIILYKTAILPIILYGHETWSLTLIKEHRLWVFETRMLRSVF
jgi:hypothetical protein